jgi:spore germination protein YaaH
MSQYRIGLRNGLISFLVVVMCGSTAQAQNNEYVGPHSWQESQKHNMPFVAPPTVLARAIPSDRTLTHKVFGYHPYWRSDATIQRYRFDLLSHVAYFSVGVDPSTGEVTSLRDWMTTPLVEEAHAAGTKVHLCVTNFNASNNRKLLSSKVSRDTLIAQLVRLVQARNADGVNIDFEAVAGDSRDDLVLFCRDLSLALKSWNPDAELSSAMPAVDWSNAWDMAELAQYIDLFFVMCYDYYWSGAPNAGPVAPVQGGNYNVSKTLNWYLQQGVPPMQILMGVPYYGLDWPVTSSAQNSPTTGSATALIYSTVMSGIGNQTREWSNSYYNPWYRYQSTSWHQCWYDDEESLEIKYDLVNTLDIGGIGIWALSYDDGKTELWDLISRMFSVQTSIVPTSPHVSTEFSAPFPNPASRTVPVVQLAYTNNKVPTTTQLQVYDVFGRRVWEGERLISGTDGSISVPISNLPAGMYFVSLTSGALHKRSALVIQR